MSFCPAVHVFYERKSRRKQDFIKQTASRVEYEKKFSVKTHLISDTASGIDPDRPGFAELMALVRSGVVQAVASYHIDRISRDEIELITLWRACKERKIEFITQSNGFVPYDTKLDDFRFLIEAGFAGHERRRISERTKDVLAEKKKQKIIIGGSPPGWFSEAMIEFSKPVIVLMEQGWTQYRIAKTLGVRKNKVRKIMRHYPEPFLSRKEFQCRVPLSQRGTRYRERLAAMRADLGLANDS